METTPATPTASTDVTAHDLLALQLGMRELLDRGARLSRSLDIISAKLLAAQTSVATLNAAASKLSDQVDALHTDQ